MFFLGTGLAPLWPLIWLAPIPLLWVAPRLSARWAFGVAAAAYALGGLNEWSYSRTVLPTYIVILILVLSACLFALGVTLFRMGVVRGKLWLAVLVFPAYWANVRICGGQPFDSRDVFQHQLFADEFSADTSDCFRDGNLGN